MVLLGPSNRATSHFCVFKYPAEWLSCSKPIDFDWKWKHAEFCRTLPPLWKGAASRIFFLTKLETEEVRVIYNIKWKPAFHRNNNNDRNNNNVTSREGEKKGEKSKWLPLFWCAMTANRAASLLSLGGRERNRLRYC